MERKDKAWIVIGIVDDCIKEAGQDGIPSGHLYSMLMSQWPALTLDVYQGIINILVMGKCITNKNHLLKAIK